MSQRGRVMYRLESGPRHDAISNVEHGRTPGNRFENLGQIHLRHHGARWNDEIEIAYFDILPGLAKPRAVVCQRFN